MTGQRESGSVDRTSHDPANNPSCDTAFTNANAAARFEGGRLMVLLIQANDVARFTTQTTIRNLEQEMNKRATSEKRKIFGQRQITYRSVHR
jgi:hypothetical protein